MNDLNYIENYARNMMKKHIPDHEKWDFEFNRGTRTLGICKYYPYSDKGIIGISKKHALRSDIEHVKDTILHEIAHAIAGNENGHNKVWKQVCRRIGAIPERLTSWDKVGFSHKYYLVYPETNEIVSRAHKKTNWVKYTNEYFIKGKPETKGKLVVMTHQQVVESNLLEK